MLGCIRCQEARAAFEPDGVPVRVPAVTRQAARRTKHMRRVAPSGFEETLLVGLARGLRGCSLALLTAVAAVAAAGAVLAQVDSSFTCR